MSWASIAKDTSCSFNEAAIAPQVILSKKELCPITALSCLHYDDCCVPNYGWLVLAQQWLPNKPIHAFTIHGFWPGYCVSGAKTPSSACPPSKLTKSVPEIINSDMSPVTRNQIRDYWVSGELTNNILWSHEWKDHGVCLSTVQPKCHKVGPLLDDPNKAAIRYFSLALNQYFNFDVYSKLRDNNILPRSDRPYTKDEFTNALDGWKGYYVLECIEGAIHQVKFYLLGAARNSFRPREDNERTHKCGNFIYYRPKVVRQDL